MRNRVIVEKSFIKPAKRLTKRYPSFPTDLLSLVNELELNSLIGTSLGGNVRKVRLAIKSKGKGKSGGARVITYIYLDAGRVHLLTVYDKSERDTVSDDEITKLVKSLQEADRG